MKTILKDKNGNCIEIKRMHEHGQKIKTLIEIHNQNPIKGLLANYTALINSEIFNSLYTEGHISSRRHLEKSIDERKNKDEVLSEDKYYGYAQNYKFIIRNKPSIDVSNLFSIYNSMAKHWVSKDSQLEVGHMFRHEMVYIGSNSMKGDKSGFEASKISEAIEALSIFAKDENVDIYIRAIVSHFYFELVHPYFDLNGRVGRFIPFWIFNNEDQGENMMYFSNAIGNYRNAYLKSFEDSINYINNNVNVDRFIEKILDLLILNQKQYQWYYKVKSNYIETTKKSFSPLQKYFIWNLMIKCEVQGNANSWNKLSDDDYKFIEVEMDRGQFSREIKKLQEAKVIDITDTRPPRYKLLNYELLSR